MTLRCFDYAAVAHSRVRNDERLDLDFHRVIGERHRMLLNSKYRLKIHPMGNVLFEKR